MSPGWLQPSGGLTLALYLWHLLPEDQSISITPLFSSASCRARTYDPLIKSQLLYQLS